MFDQASNVFTIYCIFARQIGHCLVPRMMPWAHSLHIDLCPQGMDTVSILVTKQILQSF
jgi:hypothetical protein